MRARTIWRSVQVWISHLVKVEGKCYLFKFYLSKIVTENKYPRKLCTILQRLQSQLQVLLCNLHLRFVFDRARFRLDFSHLNICYSFFCWKSIMAFWCLKEILKSLGKFQCIFPFCFFFLKLTSSLKACIAAIETREYNWAPDITSSHSEA